MSSTLVVRARSMQPDQFSGNNFIIFVFSPTERLAELCARRRNELAGQHSRVTKERREAQADFFEC